MRNSSFFLGAVAAATTILSFTPAGAATSVPDVPADQAAGESVETAIGPAFAAAISPADEATFISMINELRASQGLNSLTSHAELTTQARQWTQVMDDADDLHHAPDLSAGITADWQVLGENVGVHSIHDIDALFQAFIKSPTHYANLVDPRFTHVGVGVVQADDGYVWTTHRFMAVRATTPAPTQPPTTAAPATQPPATPAPTQAPTTQPPTTAPAATPTTTAPPAPSTTTPSANDSQPAPVDPTSDVAANATSGAASTSEVDDATSRLALDTGLIGDIIDEVAQSGL